MTKPKNHIKPWAIFRWTSPVNSSCIMRFRHRGDAEGYLQILRQNSPGANLRLVFDHDSTTVKID
ncbi:hypothetical protein [Iningainema tapete]|uniref:Uncharacterized protein n=1 Tax=Iningainema tapete BLCC-T55 TaxID=2748662 RepID=A0A8J7C744_9CYAN|nr:hypothetical protein [Iningainema tapete]MBD2775184.1 hypothetical protein [Iningainema tapete BLCC-T55]